MEQVVEVKIGCLFALLVISMVCGLIPICFKWFQIKAARGHPPWGLSLRFLSCISAGVFLGAGLMHMTVESLESIEFEIQKMKNRTESGGNSSRVASWAHKDYPYGGLIISLGFFSVFFLESLALQCCPETIGRSKVQKKEVSEDHDHGLHSQEPLPSRRPFRGALILLFSLSFHSVFEGLAVGLQTTVASTVQLWLAVMAHKGPVVFSVGLRLVQISTASQWAVFCIFLFSLMSPLGIALGLVVPGTDSEVGGSLAQAVLEGVAAGTFLYVTFLEILPMELAGPEAPLVKWGCVATGFAFMALIALWA